MSIENPENPDIAPEGGEGAAAPAVEQQPSFFEVASKAWGSDFKDADSYSAHAQKVQGDLKAMQEKLSAFEEGQRGSIPAIKQVESWLNGNGKQYASDSERMRDAMEWLREQSTDYNGLAASDPKALLERHYMRSNPNFTQADAREMVADEIDRITAIAAGKDFDKEEDRQAFIDNRLSLLAKQHAPSLESAKAKLDFNPQGVETAEQKAERERTAQQQAQANLNHALAGFKGISLGEAGEWEIKLLDDTGQKIREEYLPMVSKVAADWEAWLSQFRYSDGSPNFERMLQYEAMFSESGKAASRRVADARGEGAANVVNTAMNPSKNGQPTTHAPASTGLDFNSFIKTPPTRAN